MDLESKSSQYYIKPVFINLEIPIGLNHSSQSLIPTKPIKFLAIASIHFPGGVGKPFATEL